MRVLLLLVLLVGLPAAAQERLLVRPEPGTPVVTAELLLGVGPADELEGQEGLAYLTARAAVAPIRPLLDSLGARLAVDVRKDAVTFAVTAAPEVWAEATRLLLVAAFRDPVDSASVIRQRSLLAEELRARESSPADALVRHLDRAVFGPENPWGRPAVGTAASVGELRWSDVDAFLRQRFTPERARIAVIGPVERAEVETHLATFLPDTPPQRFYAPTPDPADSVVHVEYDAITAWVGVSYAFGREVEAEAVRMLADLVLDRVSFGPSTRSVYDARAQVVRYAGGRGEMRLTLVVPPREAAVWADRLQEAVAAHRRAPLEAPVFAERLRRYRGRRLLALDSPEARVEALARVLLAGDGEDPLAAGRGLTPVALHDAAGALQPPVVVLLGPFEGE